MSYQYAGLYAILKRVLGWLIFIPAFISTAVSLTGLAAIQRPSGDGVNAVINDFFRVLAEMVQFNTPFLDFFWRNSPIPNTQMGFSQENITFFVIFLFMFIGLVLYLFSGQQVISLKNLEQFNPVAYVKSHSIFDAVTFMLLGAFMLILTPIFRVISTFIIFVKTKDKMYTIFTAIVMVIILVSIILGFIVEPK